MSSCRSLCLAVLVLAWACAEPERNPPPPGSGAPGSGAAGASAGEGGLDSASVGDPIPERDCDPWQPGTDCDPDEVCSFVDMQCHEATGTAGLDQSCQLIDPRAWVGTCAPGLVCVVEQETFGRCAIPCLDDEGCDIDRQCRVPVGESPVRVCVQPCDLFEQDCPPDEGCYVLRPDDPGPLCAPEGPGVETDPCETVTDCAIEHHCTAPLTHMVPCESETGCCTPYCDVEVGDCVGINPICVSLGVPGMPGIGVCVGEV